MKHIKEPLEKSFVMIYLTILFWLYSMKELRGILLFLSSFIPYNEVEAKVTPAEQVSQSEALSL